MVFYNIKITLNRLKHELKSEIGRQTPGYTRKNLTTCQQDVFAGSQQACSKLVNKL
jgi:hypothetical protein